MLIYFLQAEAKFYVGAQVTMGRPKVKEEDVWDGTETIETGPRLIKGEQNYAFSRNSFMFGVYSGLMFTRCKYINWYNDIGFSFNFGKANHQPGIINFLLNNRKLNNLNVGKIQVKKKWMFQYRSELGFVNERFEPFIGATFLFTQVEHSYEFRGLNTSSTSNENKVHFGFGPTFGLRIKINEHLRSKIFGELHFLNNWNRSITNTTPIRTTEGTVDLNGKSRIKINSWRFGLGLEYKF